MASASASTLIIFIAAIGVAAAVSGTMVETVTDISDSFDEQGADVERQIDTDIEIISDSGSGAVYDGTNVTVLVKNTGARTVTTEEMDVLLDGRYVAAADYETTVVGGGAWVEDAVVRLEMTASLDAGDHRVLVVVNGQREVLRFHV